MDNILEYFFNDILDRKENKVIDKITQNKSKNKKLTKNRY
jgi:hypothetical protein